ncbi:MerR family transcriptional regulator [Denitrificimonas caeni]|uniref:MerR family transcriptional regulator n=1 Tax=Denitrificimonas caeni TaxID=521720 RepID=UPI001964FE05|nr:MerR family transcriptional regulator [Denitrificimonas caeni]
MQIKQVAEKTGLSRDTIRFYEQQGLIAEPKRADNGYRHYDESVILHLNMINQAKDLGFTLKEIKQLVQLLYSRELTQAQMQRQLQIKREEINRKLSELESIRQQIDLALAGLCKYREQLKA